ncbi:hypothetical protein [Tropicibacter alexandrii]|uniref:hypothetical protein n=1 Tax=Tropicibacter alexandrii TaxID=2267683 RepID=UPI000EF44889|nr:hypothetical protein [Tropicibacter alexandrii]
MPDIKTQIGEITYNCAEGCFEALVTFHTTQGPHRVAARCNAPLTAEFDELSDGLLTDALTRFARPDALQSWLRAEDAELPRAA